MCGIAAFIANKGVETKEVIPFVRMIAIVQDSRGRDNAGVAFLNKSGNISIFRGAQPAENFTSKNEATLSNLLFNRGADIVEKMTDTDLIFLGHSRKASVGSTTLDNTHPFTFSNTGLYGVHNGTIKNIEEMSEYLKMDVKSCKTDSEAIYMMLNEKGYDQVFPLYDNSLQRGGAFVWGHSGKDYLNVYVGYNKLSKSQERPLHYLTCPYGTFISSELKYLELLGMMLLDSKFSAEEISLGAFTTDQLHTVKGSVIEKVGEKIVKNVQESIKYYNSYNNSSLNYSGNSQSYSKGTPKKNQVHNNLMNYRLAQLKKLKAPFIHNGRYCYNNRYLCNSFLLPGESYVMMEIPDLINLGGSSENKIHKDKTSFGDTYSIAIRTADNKFYFIDKPNSLFIKPKKEVIDVNFFRGLLMNNDEKWQIELEEVGTLSNDTLYSCSMSPYPVRSILNASLNINNQYTVCLQLNDAVLKGNFHYPYTNIAGSFQNGTAYLYFIEQKKDSCPC